MHYHIIPAPSFNNSLSAGSGFQKSTGDDGKVPLTSKDMHKLEFESRQELDHDEAEGLVKSIRARL